MSDRDTYYDDYYDDEIGCGYCSNTGWRIICPDDMCRGQYDGDEFAPCGDSKCVQPCQHCNKEGHSL